MPFERLEETVAETAQQLAAIPASQLAAMKLVVNHAYSQAPPGEKPDPNNVIEP